MKKLTPIALLAGYVILFIALGQAPYDRAEWWYAIHSDPSAGIAVLGSQGDVWDAQKDMLADVLGALFATGLFWLVYRRSPAYRGLGGDASRAVDV